MDAVTAAFSRFFDYAGLFPPAGLPLEDVMGRYGEYRRGPHAWMLGRVIVPAERLEEAQAAARAAGASAEDPWPTSVLVGDGHKSRDVAAGVIPLSRPGAGPIVEAVESAAREAPRVCRGARTPFDSVQVCRFRTRRDRHPLHPRRAANARGVSHFGWPGADWHTPC